MYWPFIYLTHHRFYPLSFMMPKSLNVHLYCYNMVWIICKIRNMQDYFIPPLSMNAHTLPCPYSHYSNRNHPAWIRTYICCPLKISNPSTSLTWDPKTIIHLHSSLEFEFKVLVLYHHLLWPELDRCQKMLLELN